MLIKSKVFNKSTSLFTILVFLITLIIPTSMVYGDQAKSITISVTDASKNSIQQFVDVAGSTSNTILTTPVRLAANAQAHFSLNNLTNVKLSKYSFVPAANTTTLPTFPKDSDMKDLSLPQPNTYQAYATDVGDNGYVTVKHYAYQGKQNTAVSRDVSFGTSIGGDVVLRQMAKSAIDIYETQGVNSSAFLYDKSSNNLVYNNSQTSVYSNKYVTGSTTYWNKNAGMKAMKMWGYFVPQKSGSYLLGAYADDGAYGYITIDGVEKVFVNDWRIAGPQFRTTPDGKDGNNTSSSIAVTYDSKNKSGSNYKFTGVNLVKGNYYPIYMEWYEGCATQGAFVPQYVYNSQNDHAFDLSNDASGIFNGTSSTTYQDDTNESTNGMHSIPQNEFYNSLTPTPGEISTAYFGDLSGISFPSQDGIYYIAEKFVSGEGTSQGLYGPFIIDNTKPVLKSITVTSNNGNNNKLATDTNSITIKFTASEDLKTDPQLIVDGIPIYNVHKSNNNSVLNWSKDANNNYTVTVKIGQGPNSDGTTGPDGTDINKTLLTQGAIDVSFDHYSDLSGNDGDVVHDGSVTFDNVAPTVNLSYSSNPATVGTETITATYSELLKTGEIPQISINQPGTTDVLNQNMTQGADSRIWTYNYSVNKDNGGTYVDGNAIVSLSTTHDPAGNTSILPTNNTFTISTINPTLSVGFAYNPVRAYDSSESSPVTQVITATYSKPLKSGEIPQISINQPGTADISNQNMIMGADSSIWTFPYRVNKDNGGTYKDGTAKVSFSNVHDSAGNSVTQLSEYDFVIDTKAPTVSLSYLPNIAIEGTETITATYSEPIKAGEVPLISIDQAGATDISLQNMTVGADRSIWTYNYTVHKDDGNNYIDGPAGVVLTQVVDLAGNVSSGPTNTNFTIDTTPPSIGIAFKDPAMQRTATGAVDFIVTYDASATQINLTANNVHLKKVGSAETVTGSIAVNGLGNQKTVMISGMTDSGNFYISIDPGTAQDAAGNTSLAKNSPEFEIFVPITGVNITAPQYLRVNSKNTLTASILPTNAIQGVTWSWTSSDAGVVQIDSDGTITGIKKGTVTVKATAVGTAIDNSHPFATRVITIIDPQITATINSSTSTPAVWSRVTLTPSIISNVDIDTSKPITLSNWNVSPDKSGTFKIVDANSENFTGNKVGNVTISVTLTAKALDGSDVTCIASVTLDVKKLDVNIG